MSVADLKPMVPLSPPAKGNLDLSLLAIKVKA